MYMNTRDLWFWKPIPASLRSEFFEVYAIPGTAVKVEAIERWKETTWRKSDKFDGLQLLLFLKNIKSSNGFRDNRYERFLRIINRLWWNLRKMHDRLTISWKPFFTLWKQESKFGKPIEAPPSPAESRVQFMSVHTSFAVRAIKSGMKSNRTKFYGPILYFYYVFIFWVDSQ